MGTDLDGKVVLVTGAGSGIGEACARRAAAGGARVAVVDIELEAAERVASEIGGEARGIKADVGEEDSLAEMVATIIEQFGRLDGAINNAGVGGQHLAVGDYPFEDWRRVMRVTSTACSSACAKRSGRCARTAAARSSTWRPCWRRRGIPSRSRT
jgi:NAD(P)-dependent dehydrogenase (short-subunit alcohol dehydrogenase family)